MLRLSAFLFASVAVVGPAAGDRYSVHGTASIDAAVTDNVSSLGGIERSPELFFTLRPGALFTYALPRMIHEINAELELMRYATTQDQPTIAGRGGWKALFIPGPLSEVIITANASRSMLSAISAASAPVETSVALVPIGNVDVTQGDISEYGSYTASRETRLFQTVFGRAGKTDDNAPDMTRTIISSQEAGGAFGLDRSFKKTTLSLETGVSYSRLERLAEVNAPMGSRLDRQVNFRARVQWRRDLSRKLSTAVDGGVAVVVPVLKDPYHPDVTRNVGTFPIVGGQLAYTDVWGLATLAVRRDVTPNLFVAANTVNDSATLAAAVPLYWLENGNRRRSPKLAGVGSFGIQRTQVVSSETAELTGSFIVGRIDAGVVYVAQPGVTYSARYELIAQTGDETAEVSQAGFFRQTVYVTAAVRFPADVAVRVPKRRTNSVRADRKDLSPSGAEPVIPDLTESGSEGGEQ